MSLADSGVSGLGRLIARHFPDGPVGPPSRWAATSHVEVGGVGREGREGSLGQSHKEEDKERGSGTATQLGREPGPLVQEGGSI